MIRCSQMKRRLKLFFFSISSAALLCLIYCEFLHYFFVLFSCSWPTVSGPDSVKALVFADTHLLGSRNGHWFDKLRREWQMRRAFQTAVFYFQPEVIIHVGDAFDEGKWCSDAEFEYYVGRFEELFRADGALFMVAAGNHDTGTSLWERTEKIKARFDAVYGKGPVWTKTVKSVRFVIVDSMVLDMERKGIDRLNRVSKELQQDQGSRPILITHFPLFRPSDANCSEVDEAPGELKNVKWREGVEGLRRATSKLIMDKVQPRLVFNGHSHHGCKLWHEQWNAEEWTLSSFSWRNKNNPSFLLAEFTPEAHAISKCAMPHESTVILLYWLSGSIGLILGSILFLFPTLGTRVFSYVRSPKLAKN